jgi:GTP cyclohydrolase FolE2
MKLFKKRKWSKWEHVRFVEDWRAGTPVYELLKRTDELSGLTEYKNVFVSSCIHTLGAVLNQTKPPN